jgi:activator of 2-hydroxyglutaryl-CoA dehydratase
MTEAIEKYYLGVDVGSISTNVALINEKREVIESVYIRTEGKPIESVQKGIQQMREKLGKHYEISGAGAQYVLLEQVLFLISKLGD